MFFLVIKTNFLDINKNTEKMDYRFYKNITVLNQHIRMISDGLCDTEDWSNDTKNSALITGTNYILKYIKIEIYILK